jgi:hypothetical protein
MVASNRSPQDIVNDIYTHVIDPLRDFRKNVSPLNSNQIDGVSDFARLIDGLLTGSDGELAWQGPASDALANLIGQYLDKEQKLTGYDDTMLEGRLEGAARLCEKYANDIETNFAPTILGKPGAHGASTSAFLLQPLADGPGDDKPQGGRTLKM